MFEDGKFIKARPLHGGLHRRSETEALKEDLASEGFSPDSPVVWLSPGTPVSRLGPHFIIDQAKLDARRLIYTMDANGSMLYVGDIPQRAIVNFVGGKTAATIDDIARRTSPDVHARARRVAIRNKRNDPSRGIWLFEARGSSGNVYRVRLKAIRKGNTLDVRKLQVQVSCSCPFFRWQGPEHWAKANKFLYGRPRGTASRPDIKDPGGNHWACKHVLAVLNPRRPYYLERASAKGRRASESLEAMLRTAEILPDFDWADQWGESVGTIADRFQMKTASQLSGLSGHTFYHGTFLEDAMSIRREGFKFNKMRHRGAFMGRAVYIAGKRESALDWANNVRDEGHDAGLLHLRIHPKKPLSADPKEWPEDMRTRYAERTGKDPDNANRDGLYREIGSTARDLGYDAIIYKEGTTIVFDPSVIRPVNVEVLRAEDW